MVCVFNNDCIDVRKIQTGLDNGCANKNIGFLCIKLCPNFFHFASIPLCMDNSDSCVWKTLLQSSCHFKDIRNLVMEIENLSSTIKLFLDNLFNQFLVLLGNIGLNRPTIHRCFCQIRQSTDSKQRPLPCTRNRSRSQSQTVDILCLFFNFLFMCNPEFLFLIDN